MSMSGIKVNQEVNQLLTQWTAGNKSKVKYAVLAIKKDDDTARDQVKIMKTRCAKENETEGKNFISEILEELDKKKSGWFVTEVNYDFADKDTGSHMVRSKLVLILWNPEDAPVKMKMIYAATHDTVRKLFEAKGRVLQVNELDEFKLENFIEKIKSQ